MRKLRQHWSAIALGLAVLAFPGCASMRSWNPFADKQPTGEDLQQASFEEIPEAVPDPKNPNQLKLAYARWMEERGDIGEARTHYDAVRQAEPKNVEAVLGMARVDLLSGRAAEAEQGFQRALKLNPNSAAAHYELGRCYESQERWTDAVAELNKAVLADPAHTPYRYQLAVVLTKSGDVDGALTHFVRVVGDAEAHYNVGLILKDMGRLPEAEKHMELALAKKPSLKQAEQWLQHIRQQQTGEKPEHSLVSRD